MLGAFTGYDVMLYAWPTNHYLFEAMTSDTSLLIELFLLESKRSNSNGDLSRQFVHLGILFFLKTTNSITVTWILQLVSDKHWQLIHGNGQICSENDLFIHHDDRP